MIRCNQHTGHLAAQAQQEIDIMHSLSDAPKTPSQLCEQFGLPSNRVSYLLRGLYEAKCIKKINRSHKIFLLTVDRANST